MVEVIFILYKYLGTNFAFKNIQIVKSHIFAVNYISRTRSIAFILLAEI